MTNEAKEALKITEFEDELNEKPDGQTLLQQANKNFRLNTLPEPNIMPNGKTKDIGKNITDAYYYYKKGYRYNDNTLVYYDENNKPTKFDYWTQTLFAIDKDILSCLKDMTKQFEQTQQSLDLEQEQSGYGKLYIDAATKAARDLEEGKIDFKVYNRTELFDQLVTFNGKFYARVKGTNNMIPIPEGDINYTLYDLYYTEPAKEIDAKIVSLRKIIQQQNYLKDLPDYVFRPGKPKDNGFRFNKTAYRLIHFYLREARNDNKDAYIMTIMSKGGQGKSTFSNFLKCLFRYEYYSADSKFINQFTTSFIAPYRLTVFNDCSSTFISNAHILKQVSGGGQDIQIEAKGRQAYTGNIDTRLLFIGNEDLKYNILDSGLMRRFVNMPWDNTVIKEYYTPEFGYEEVEPAKDKKWVNYKWTDDEIAFQVELADKLYEYDLKDKLDLDDLCNRTIKKVLLSHPAIRSDNYKDYTLKNGIQWSEEHYKQYFEDVKDYMNKGIITREDIIDAREKDFTEIMVDNFITDYLGVPVLKPEE